VSPMAQPFYLLEQAERCRRLARDSTDPALRDSLLKLADEYTAQANIREDDDTPVWRARPDGEGPA
jgi:hypothetical protein